MSFRLRPTFRDALAEASRPLAGMWVCSGSPLVAEICAGAGLDWLLVDMEHSPNGLESVLAQLQAVAAEPVTPVVRVPIGDVVTIKQVLDLGAQNLLVPMISTADEARAIVAAVRYPPRGRRGVGSALARSARWNRVDGYLTDADAHVSLFVQVETAEGVENRIDLDEHFWAQRRLVLACVLIANLINGGLTAWLIVTSEGYAPLGSSPRFLIGMTVFILSTSLAAFAPWRRVAVGALIVVLAYTVFAVAESAVRLFSQGGWLPAVGG